MERGVTISPTDVLGDGGLVARRMPQFESRPQQLEMAQAVESAIAEQRHLVVEAGTGTGKSFAYLVPAILAASARHPGSGGSKAKPIIISTHTISLQEQLVDRDIPFLNAVMPVEFSAVLAKGRSNYISLRRLKGAVEKHRSLFATDEEERQLARVAEWSGKTTDGSRANLDFQPFSVV